MNFLEKLVKTVLREDTATRALWDMGLLGAHRVSMLTSQKLTQRPHPVYCYSSVEELTEASSTLTWTEDPWGGKLDIVKHPTYMQEAIDLHPAVSGDCDDYAFWWARALTKGRSKGKGEPLATKVAIGMCLWRVDPRSVGGHACCVFTKPDGSMWWVSNWEGCKPLRIYSPDEWIDQMMGREKKPLIVAGRVDVAGFEGDTVLPGKAVRRR